MAFKTKIDNLQKLLEKEIPKNINRSLNNK